MDVVAILKKHFPDSLSFGIILKHSRLVADKALQVAGRLEGWNLDMNFIEEAAFLHDIGVCRTNAPGLGCRGSDAYIRHGIIGREILENEGLPLHALVCERHIGVGLTAQDVISQRLPLPEREMVPLSLEEKIICFADLFNSKNPGDIGYEKTILEVTRGLAKFGEQKVKIFDGWLKEFG